MRKCISVIWSEKSALFLFLIISVLVHFYLCWEEPSLACSILPETASSGNEDWIVIIFRED